MAVLSLDIGCAEEPAIVRVMSLASDLFPENSGNESEESSRAFFCERSNQRAILCHLPYLHSGVESLEDAADGFLVLVATRNTFLPIMLMTALIDPRFRKSRNLRVLLVEPRPRLYSHFVVPDRRTTVRYHRKECRHKCR